MDVPTSLWLDHHPNPELKKGNVFFFSIGKKKKKPWSYEKKKMKKKSWKVNSFSGRKKENSLIYKSKKTAIQKACQWWWKVKHKCFFLYFVSMLNIKLLGVILFHLWLSIYTSLTFSQTDLNKLILTKSTCKWNFYKRLQK